MRTVHLAVVLGLLTFSIAALAHNNPTFREDLLLTVTVNTEPTADGSHSAPFSLEWPKKTVQLIWRLADDGGDTRFAVAQDGNKVSDSLSHDSASGRLQGDGFTIIDVTGAETGDTFALEIYAKVLDRSKKK